MTTTKTKPLPAKFATPRPFGYGHSSLEIYNPATGTAIAKVLPCKWDGKAAANAAFIIHACNNIERFEREHGELLEVVKNLRLAICAHNKKQKSQLDFVQGADIHAADQIISKATTV